MSLFDYLLILTPELHASDGTSITDMGFEEREVWQSNNSSFLIPLLRPDENIYRVENQYELHNC